MTFSSRSILVGLFLLGGATCGDVIAHDETTHAHGKEGVSSLGIDYVLRGDGKLEAKQKFQLRVEGERIKRGPCLSFLTVYDGPGGLILDNRMAVESVVRNGNVEPYHIEYMDGMDVLFVGASDVELNHGVHEYEVKYSADGNWKFQDGDVSAGFDLLEAFRNTPVDSASIRFVLPEGTEIKKASISYSDAEPGNPGYAIEQITNGFQISTAGPIVPGQHLFLNLTLSGDGFSKSSDWLKVMQQHPKLPISALTAFAFCCALILMIRRMTIRKEVAVAAA